MHLSELPFSIVGTGPVSRSFARAFVNAGLTVHAITSRSYERAKDLAAEIAQCSDANPQAFQLPSTDGSNRDDIAEANKCRDPCAVLVAVPDSALTDTLCKRITRLLPGAEYVIHTSGALQSSILHSVSANFLSLHPCSPFPRDSAAPVSLTGMYFGVEGASGAVEEEGMQLVRMLNAIPFHIDRNSKGMYHAACSIANNFVWTLMHTSVETLVRSGVDVETAKKITVDFVERTADTVREVDTTHIAQALTGPIVRGDANSVGLHVAQLGGFPQARRIYKEMAIATANAAHEQGRISRSTMEDVLVVVNAPAETND